MMETFSSIHYEKQRNKREKLIKNHINGDGNVVDSFVVNKRHAHGKEIHTITNTGLIIITNQETGKLVTKLIARPAQIQRYYKKSNKEPP